MAEWEQRVRKIQGSRNFITAVPGKHGVRDSEGVEQPICPKALVCLTLLDKFSSQCISSFWVGMTRRPVVNKGGKVDFDSWFQRHHGRAVSGYDGNPRGGGRPGGTTHRMKLEADTFKDLVTSFCQESLLYPKSHTVPKQHHQ